MATDEYYKYFHRLDNSLYNRIEISGAHDEGPVIDFAHILAMMNEKMGSADDIIEGGADPEPDLAEFAPEPENADDFDKYLGEAEPGPAPKSEVPEPEIEPAEDDFEKLIMDAEISGGGPEIDEFESYLEDAGNE